MKAVSGGRRLCMVLCMDLAHRLQVRELFHHTAHVILFICLLCTCKGCPSLWNISRGGYWVRNCLFILQKIHLQTSESCSSSSFLVGNGRNSWFVLEKKYIESHWLGKFHTATFVINWCCKQMQYLNVECMKKTVLRIDDVPLTRKI